MEGFTPDAEGNHASARAQGVWGAGGVKRLQDFYTACEMVTLSEAVCDN